MTMSLLCVYTVAFILNWRLTSFCSPSRRSVCVSACIRSSSTITYERSSRESAGLQENLTYAPKLTLNSTMVIIWYDQ